MQKKLLYIGIFVFVLIAGVFVFKTQIMNEFYAHKIVKAEPKFKGLISKELIEDNEKLKSSIIEAQSVKQTIKPKNLSINNNVGKSNISSEEHEIIKKAIGDLYKKMPRLNPLLFENGKMRSNIKKHIYDDVAYYLDYFLSNNLMARDFLIVDILLKGSMGGYIYHNKSDLDMTVCIKAAKTPLSKKDEYILRQDMSKIYYSSLIGLSYDRYTSLYGMPVTFFFKNCEFGEDKTAAITKKAGIYSLFFDKWLVEPISEKLDYSKRNLYDFVVSYYRKFLDDYRFYENVLLRKTQAFNGLCKVLDDNWRLYLKHRHSSFVYLDAEGYSLQNFGAKVLDRLSIRKKIYSMKAHCEANITNLMAGAYQNVSKLDATPFIEYNIRESTFFDFERSGTCIKKDKYKEKAYSDYQDLVSDFFERTTQLPSDLWDKKGDEYFLKQGVLANIEGNIFKIKEDEINFVRGKILDILISGRGVSKYYNQDSPIIAYVVKSVEIDDKFSKKQKEYIFNEYKKIIATRQLELNYLNGAFVGKRRLKIKVFLVRKGEKFDYNKIEDYAFSSQKNRWYGKMKSFSDEVEKDKVYQLGKSLYHNLYLVNYQQNFGNSTSCMSGYDYRDLDALKYNEIYSKNKKIALEIIKNSNLYYDFRYKKVISSLANESFGKYQKYQDLFR
jgi:hypothetical protein